MGIHTISSLDNSANGSRMLDSIDRPSESWITPFRASGAKPPLFCLCAGGGDVIGYRPLADTLPDDQPVWAFGVPSPTPDQDTPFPTVEQLAEVYVAKLLQLQKRGPYQLCGHSYGGIIAYEMAAQLAKKGQQVGLLALIDAVNPRFFDDLSVMQKTKFYLTYFYDRINKYKRNIMRMNIDDIASDVRRFIRNNINSVKWKMTAANSRRRGGQPAVQAPSSVMILAVACRRYVPVPYNGPILLLNADNPNAEYKSDPTLGWKHCASGPLTIHVVPGDHRTIMFPPQVESVAGWLTSYLTSAGTR